MSKVTLIVQPWAGDRQVSEQEADALLIDAVEVDGHEVLHPEIRLALGDFATIMIVAPQEELRTAFADPGSYVTNTDEMLVLPITALEVRVKAAEA